MEGYSSPDPCQLLLDRRDDARIGRLVTLDEEGDDRQHGIARAAARTSTAGPELPVEAGEHEITATVRAEFELSFE